MPDDRERLVEERDGYRITYFGDGLGFMVERIEPIEWSAINDPTDWSIRPTQQPNSRERESG